MGAKISPNFPPKKARISAIFPPFPLLTPILKNFFFFIYLYILIGIFYKIGVKNKNRGKKLGFSRVCDCPLLCFVSGSRGKKRGFLRVCIGGNRFFDTKKTLTRKNTKKTVAIVAGGCYIF